MPKEMLFMVCAAAVAACATLRAANPILPLWEFVPDGEPYVFEDPDKPGSLRVYLYGSHDTRRDGYCGFDQVVWSASVDDLDDWRCEGVSFKSAVGAALLYAPDIAMVAGSGGEKTYYLYPYVHDKMRIGTVAKSTRPAGPFTVCNWSKDDPQKTDGVLGPDPAVFVDDDGRVYGYWGCHRSFAAELDPATMATVKPGCRIVADMVGGWRQPGVFRFYEGSSMRKIKGKYVFVYSRYTSPGESGLEASPYTLAYAYSDKPLGPWTFGGTLIDARAPETLPDGTARATAAPSGNTHGSLCEIKGRWYLFYHRQTGTDEFSRQAMVAPVAVEVEDRPGGRVTISKAELTSEGFETSGLDPFRRHAAGIASHYTGPAPAKYKWPHCTYSGPYPEPFRTDGYSETNPYSADIDKCALAHCTDGSVVGYKYFDFTKTHGRANLKCEVALEPSGYEAKCEIWAVRPSAAEGGVKLGEFTIGKGAPEGLQTFSADVAPLAERNAREALYFVFSSPCKGRSLCRIESFRFCTENISRREGNVTRRDAEAQRKTNSDSSDMSANVLNLKTRALASASEKSEFTALGISSPYDESRLPVWLYIH